MLIDVSFFMKIKDCSTGVRIEKRVKATKIRNKMDLEADYVHMKQNTDRTKNRAKD